MFAFDRLDAQRIAVSAAGALLFSAICIGGAVAPAQAATIDANKADDVAVWQSNATRHLDGAMAPVIVQARATATQDARIAVTVDAHGNVGTPTIVQSSGNRTVDARLLRRAATLKLSPLPASLAAMHKPVELHVDLTEDGQRAPRIAGPVRYAAR